VASKFAFTPALLTRTLAELQAGGDEGGDLGLDRDVAGHEGGTQLARGLPAGLRVASAEHHRRAVGDEPLDDRTADPARPAGDDRHLAAQRAPTTHVRCTTHDTVII
jgi:hypothetical protein